MVRFHIQYHGMTNLFCRLYGTAGPGCANVAVSINDSITERFSCNNNTWPEDQQVLWSNTSLGPGSHTLTFTHDDVNRKRFSLDFFRSVIGEVR
jgi:hypothetical protein